MQQMKPAKVLKEICTSKTIGINTIPPCGEKNVSCGRHGIGTMCLKKKGRGNVMPCRGVRKSLTIINVLLAYIKVPSA